MVKLFPIITALALCLVVLSCSDETTTPQDTVSLSGVVRSGSSGVPMDGASVVALGSESGKELSRTTSASDGSFTLLNVPRVTVDLLVQKSGFVTRRVEDLDPATQLDPENTGVNVRMIPDSGGCCNGVLTLTVKDQAGLGIPQARVQIKKNGNLIEDPRTGNDGVVVVDNLCPGAYSIRVSRDGYRVSEAVFVINETCDPVTLTSVIETIQICCTGTLTLTVKDAQAAVISGATVKLWKGGSIVRTGITGSNGVVVFDSLCTGSYGVDVEKQGYEHRELTFSIGELCAPVEKFAVLEAPACCSGVFTYVLRDNANNPLAGAKVLIKRNGVVVREITTNSNGTIVADSLCQGEYSIRVSKDGWKVLEGNFAINSSCDPVSRDGALEPLSTECCTGVFTLVVKDANGNPVQGARVIVKKGGVAKADPTTNAQGGIGVDGLCAGEYSYRISKDGWQTIEGVFVINSSCEPVAREVVMTQNPTVCCSGVLTLTVRDSSGNPLQNARVYIKKGGTIIEDPITNANGQVVVDGLCAGAYTWKISRDGYSINEGSFSINENCDPVVREVNLNAIVVCCSGVLTVTVVDGSNAPVDGATVKLWQGGAIKATLITSSNGVVQFGNLCKGAYGVDVSKTGLRTREFQFSIGEGCDPFNKTVELVP